MGTSKGQLEKDLHAAMKARDELTTATLRMALTAIRNAEVAGKTARELSGDEVQQVLAKEAKKRREAAEAFADAGRRDKAEAELAEERVLAAYLPQPLPDDELETLVSETLAEGGFSDPSKMGPAMKAVQAKVAGRADGKRVAAMVRQQLSGA